MGKYIPVEPEKWAEMVKAMAENRLLKSEVDRLKNNCDYLDRELDREIDKTAMLCGQVELLRKAGDKLVEAIQEMDVIIDMDSEHPEVNAWNAAKEGKQP